MTKADFKNETFGYPKEGERGFKSGSIYGNKYKNIDSGLVHLKRCFGEGDWKSPTNTLIKLWKKAKNLEEFKKLIKEDSKAKLTQFSAVLLKDDWHFLRSILGNKKFNTFSDAGGVKVGNDNFSFIISNGYGDGKTRCAIFESEEEFNSSAFNFITSISGNFNIYSYDCGSEIEKSLNGRYGIYSKNGFVCFVKWKK